MNHIIPKYYKYIVVFNNNSDNNTPVLKLQDFTDIKKDNCNRMHLLDDDVANILPILNYCLHLPRTEMDVCDTDTLILDKSHDTSHDILICPASMANLVISQSKPDLVLYDDLYDKILKDTIKSHPDIAYAKKSELSFAKSLPFTSSLYSPLPSAGVSSIVVSGTSVKISSFNGSSVVSIS